MRIERAIKIMATQVYNARGSLLRDYRNTYCQFLIDSPKPPLTTEESVLGGITGILARREMSFDPRWQYPYWDPKRPYDPLAIVAVCTAFADEHREPLPTHIYPPWEHILQFKEQMIATPGKKDVISQLEILLDITGNNLVAAANIGFIASRLFARGAELRAYPQLKEQDLYDWSQVITPFETYNSREKTDSVGDNYYFWTQFFAACALKACPAITAPLIDKAFVIGTPIMVAARKIAGQPTVSSHHEASIIGRNIGLTAIDYCVEKALLKPLVEI